MIHRGEAFRPAVLVQFVAIDHEAIGVVSKPRLTLHSFDGLLCLLLICVDANQLGAVLKVFLFGVPKFELVKENVYGAHFLTISRPFLTARARRLSTFHKGPFVKYAGGSFWVDQLKPV